MTENALAIDNVVPYVYVLEHPNGVAFALSSGRTFALTLCQQLPRTQRLASRYRRAECRSAALIDWLEIRPGDDARLQFRYTGYTRADDRKFFDELLPRECTEIQGLLHSVEVVEFERFAAENKVQTARDIKLALLPEELPSYSHLEVWLANQRYKKTAQQWGNEIRKLGGISDDERYWSGVIGFLSKQPPTKTLFPSELIRALDFSPVELKLYAAMQGRVAEMTPMEACDEPLDSKSAERAGLPSSHCRVVLRHSSFSYRVIKLTPQDLLGKQVCWVALSPNSQLLEASDKGQRYIFDSPQAAVLAIKDHYFDSRYCMRRAEQFSSRWEEQSSEGGFGYKEWLVTLEKFPHRYTVRNHFDTPNILIHIRTSEHVSIDGSHLLLIEEIQSDWLQRRDEENCIYTDAMGCRRKIPWSSHWGQLGIHIALLIGAKLGVDGVSLVTGSQQNARNGLDELEPGLEHLYDGILLKSLRRVASDWSSPLASKAIPFHRDSEQLCRYKDGYTIVDDEGHAMTRPMSHSEIHRYRVARDRDKLEAVPTLLLSSSLREHLLTRGIPRFGKLL